MSPLIHRARPSRARSIRRAAGDRAAAAAARRRTARRRRSGPAAAPAPAARQRPPGDAVLPRRRETMFFAGLISAFFVLRLAAPVWPPPLQPRLPVLVTGINTLILLASSAAMIAALRGVRGAAIGRGARRAARRSPRPSARCSSPCRATSGSGSSTTASRDVGRLRGDVLHADRRCTPSTWSAPSCGWASRCGWSPRGRFLDGARRDLRACAIYWHFVVGLWPILYVAVYLA